MKMKLPFLQLEKEFVQIVSPEDLKKIVGGTYGGPTASWDTTAGMLENLSGMISAGLFDYNGSATDLSGTYDLSALNGSGSTPFNIFNVPTGSLNPNLNYFTLGSIGAYGLGLGSAVGSTPGAFYINVGSFSGQMKNVGPGLHPELDVQLGDTRFSFKLTATQFTFNINLHKPTN
jgi:hypothetical protein